MADDNALRQRRKRLHRAGDHSLCVPARCPALTAAAPRGRFAAAVEELAVGLGLAADDPRRLDLEMVRALAPQVDAGNTAAVAQARAILEKLPLVRPPASGPNGARLLSDAELIAADPAQLDPVDAIRRRRLLIAWRGDTSCRT